MSRAGCMSAVVQPVVYPIRPIWCIAMRIGSVMGAAELATAWFGIAIVMRRLATTTRRLVRPRLGEMLHVLLRVMCRASITLTTVVSVSIFFLPVIWRSLTSRMSLGSLPVCWPSVPRFRATFRRSFWGVCRSAVRPASEQPRSVCAGVGDSTVAAARLFLSRSGVI